MSIFAEFLLSLLWLRIFVWSCLGAAQNIRVRRSHLKLTTEPGTLSVIVPAFNEADVIQETLRSLLSLTPPPREIIVVDDGSSDDTANIARNVFIGMPNYRVLCLPENVGKAGALNAGIEEARGEFVATVDADTHLTQRAVSLAFGRLLPGDADAVAMQIDVDNADQFITRIQHHEYAASLNFERAGQSIVNAICILPGAATLFRRAVLGHTPFSSRTRTEDADLTLSLGRRGRLIGFAAEATARTLVPDNLTRLLVQRIRWTMGHLQCAFFHADLFVLRRPRHWRIAITYANFILTVLSPALYPLAFIALQFGEGSSFLALSWDQILMVSAGLVYSQRLTAIVFGIAKYPGALYFVLEPVVTGAVASMSFLGAAWCLLVGRK